MVKLYRDLFCEYVCRQTIMLYTQAVIVSEKPRDVFCTFFSLLINFTGILSGYLWKMKNAIQGLLFACLKMDESLSVGC